MAKSMQPWVNHFWICQCLLQGCFEMTCSASLPLSEMTRWKFGLIGTGVAPPIEAYCQSLRYHFGQTWGAGGHWNQKVHSVAFFATFSPWFLNLVCWSIEAAYLILAWFGYTAVKISPFFGWKYWGLLSSFYQESIGWIFASVVWLFKVGSQNTFLNFWFARFQA